MNDGRHVTVGGRRMANGCVSGAPGELRVSRIKTGLTRFGLTRETGGCPSVQSVCYPCDPWFPVGAFRVRGGGVGTVAGVLLVAGPRSPKVQRVQYADDWINRPADFSGGFRPWPERFAAWPERFRPWPKGFAGWPKGFRPWPEGFAVWPETLWPWPEAFWPWPKGFAGLRRGGQSGPETFRPWPKTFAVWPKTFRPYRKSFRPRPKTFRPCRQGLRSWPEGFRP
jgi:hypothetical protein